jgi:hypothetical protein
MIDVIECVEQISGAIPDEQRYKQLSAALRRKGLIRSCPRQTYIGVHVGRSNKQTELRMLWAEND